MRIAMIGQKGIPAKYGGVETHVHELSVGLLARGCDVYVYARTWYTQETPTTVDGVQVRYVPSVHTKHLDTATHTLFSTIDAMRQKFDVIHYHGVGPSLFAWIPRLFAPRITVISTFHTLDRKNQKWGVFARLCLRVGEWAACKFVHKTIAVSLTLQQYIRDVYDTTAAYIPNSVRLYQKKNESDTLLKWNLEPGKYFLFVARLIPLKGAHTLIDAYKQLKQENAALLDGKKLVIVGDATYTDSYVAQLKSQASSEPDIIFTGFRTGETLAQLYSHAFALIHPSEYEGLSLTVLEGMSYGLPIIVSDIPEHRLLITNSDRRFSQADVMSLKMRLIQLLQTTDADRESEGALHRQMIQAHFNIDESVAKVKALYEEAHKARDAKKQIMVART